VVTYNSADVIQACLAALPPMEVIVVDNASTDGTSAPGMIANSSNRGFAAAVNQGFRATCAELVLILNPDVRVSTPLHPLIEAAQQYGVAGGRLTDADGRTQHGFTIRRFPTAAVLALELLGLNRVWPRNPWNRDYRYLDRDLALPGPADQPAGAFLMIRRDVWTALGGFDEGFHPIWFEDVDFCLRASRAGFPPYYQPLSQAIHVGGHSIRKLPGLERQLFWYDSLLRFAQKHFRPAELRGLCLAGALGALLRAAAAVIQERSLHPVIHCWAILKFLGRRLVSRPTSGLAPPPGSEY
jgi:GT2 family glycosyltransferase